MAGSLSMTTLARRCSSTGPDGRFRHLRRSGGSLPHIDRLAAIGWRIRARPPRLAIERDHCLLLPAYSFRQRQPSGHAQMGIGDYPNRVPGTAGGTITYSMSVQLGSGRAARQVHSVLAAPRWSRWLPAGLTIRAGDTELLPWPLATASLALGALLCTQVDRSRIKRGGHQPMISLVSASHRTHVRRVQCRSLSVRRGESPGTGKNGDTAPTLGAVSAFSGLPGAQE